MQASTLEIPKRVKNLTGMVYGNLVIQGYIGTVENTKACQVANWLCRCSCGSVCERSSTSLNESRKKGYVSMCTACTNLKFKKRTKNETDA